MSRVATNRAVFVLALLGVGLAGYLTLTHLAVADLGCSRLHGCAEVDKHPSASGFGIPALRSIPTAAFGLLMYLAVAAGSFARAASSRAAVVEAIGRAQWLAACGGVLVTVYLTYLEAYVIHAWCQWCIASGVTTTLMAAVLTAERFLKAAPAAPTASA